MPAQLIARQHAFYSRSHDSIRVPREHSLVGNYFPVAGVLAVPDVFLLLSLFAGDLDFFR